MFGKIKNMLSCIMIRKYNRYDKEMRFAHEQKKRIKEYIQNEGVDVEEEIKMTRVAIINSDSQKAVNIGIMVSLLLAMVTMAVAIVNIAVSNQELFDEIDKKQAIEQNELTKQSQEVQYNQEAADANNTKVINEYKTVSVQIAFYGFLYIGLLILMMVTMVIEKQKISKQVYYNVKLACLEEMRK